VITNVRPHYSVSQDLNHRANSRKPVAVMRNKLAGTDDSTYCCLSENKCSVKYGVVILFSDYLACCRAMDTSGYLSMKRATANAVQEDKINS
jgi:hypothetical protein